MSLFLLRAQDGWESIHYTHVLGQSHPANSESRDLEDLLTGQGRKCWLRLLFPMTAAEAKRRLQRKKFCMKKLGKEDKARHKVSDQLVARSAT